MPFGAYFLAIWLGALPPDHPPVAADGGSMSAEEVMKRLDASAELKKRPKTFDIASAMGRLYYAHGRYDDALELLREAVGKGERIAVIAASSRKALGASAYGQVAPATPSDCGFASGSTFESWVPAVEAKAKISPKLGAACAKTALKEVAALQLLEAQAQFVQKRPAEAVKTLTGLLELSPEQLDARYARGYIVFDSHGDDLPALKAAQSDVDAYVMKVPAGLRSDEAKQLSSRIAKAIAAGGVTALEKKEKPTGLAVSPAPAPSRPPFAGMSGAAQSGGASPPALTQEMVDAVQNTERTPELEKKFAETVEQGEALLAKGQYQEALDAYKRVVPFQPENGRAKAGMAWALVGLNKQPMADRIWGVAVSSDAAAVEKLGDALKAKGDGKGATALWSRLAQSRPDYAERLQAKLH